MNAVFPVILIVFMASSVISTIHWGNTLQFGSFLVSHILLLTTLAMIIIYLRRCMFPSPIILGMTLGLTGGISNTTVMAINGGFMPVPIDYPYKEYIPMAGAKLTWLADWIFGSTSPGDVVMILGLILISIGTVLYLNMVIKRLRGRVKNEY